MYEKIKAEIERLDKLADKQRIAAGTDIPLRRFHEGERCAYNKVYTFLNTLKKEQPIEDTEYICKDALLEWLNEARAVPHNNAIARDLAFQEVINKINSL